MSPTGLVTSLSELVGQLNRLTSNVADEADDVTGQWAGLVAAGGGRDDHAAALMVRLRPALAEMARFAGAAVEQITRAVADPFGRNA
jgi:phage-related minor tail protein